MTAPGQSQQMCLQRGSLIQSEYCNPELIDAQCAIEDELLPRHAVTGADARAWVCASLSRSADSCWWSLYSRRLLIASPTAS